MQGFVSNKDAEGVGDKGDPMEGLLYQLFVATSERADMAALAQVLSVDVGKMTEAVSIACRLGFGTNISAPSLRLCQLLNITCSISPPWTQRIPCSSFTHRHVPGQLDLTVRRVVLAVLGGT